MIFNGSGIAHLLQNQCWVTMHHFLLLLLKNLGLAMSTAAAAAVQGFSIDRDCFHTPAIEEQLFGPMGARDSLS